MVEDREALELTESIEEAERLFIEDFDTWDMAGYYLYSKLWGSGVSRHIGTGGLVIRDDTGTIQGVRYDELAPILLNVVQKQKRLLGQQEKLLTDQGKQLHDLQRQFAQFRRQYAAQLATARGEELALAK